MFGGTILFTLTYPTIFFRQKLMNTTEEFAVHLRHRQQQLGNLESSERVSRLSVELNELWKGVSSTEKLALIGDLERILPLGVADSPGARREGATPSPATVQAFDPETLSLDELLSLTRKKLSLLGGGEREEAEAQVASRLGLKTRTAPAASQPTSAGSIALEKLVGALDSVKDAALGDPDLLLNPRLKVFSKTDIKNLIQFAGKLRKPANELTEYLWGRFSPGSRDLLQHFSMRAADKAEIEDALEAEFDGIISGECFYTERRFAGVQLTAEAARLLQHSSSLEGRQLERLNQALLESAFPEELCFQTAEREFLDRLRQSLTGLGRPDISVDQVLGLAAVSLRELGCLEQFARMILIGFNKNVFDEVFGHISLDGRNDLNQILTDYMQKGDAEKLSTDIRNWTGLIKSLLNWYSYTAGMGAKPINALNPTRFFDLDGGDRKTFAGDIPIKAWDKYVIAFKAFRQELFHGAGKNDDKRKFTEDVLRELINQTVERKVTTTVAVRYGWNLREDD